MIQHKSLRFFKCGTCDAGFVDEECLREHAEKPDEEGDLHDGEPGCFNEAADFIQSCFPGHIERN